MKRRCTIVRCLMGVGLTVVCAQPPVFAQDPIHKAGRGAVNILTGWIELPKQLHLGMQEEDPVRGMAWGIVKGLGLMVLRGGVGAYEVLTFPLPYPKGYASPYDAMELSDYAWE